MATLGFDNCGYHITAMKSDKTDGARIILFQYRRSFQRRRTANSIHRQNNLICQIKRHRLEGLKPGATKKYSEADRSDPVPASESIFHRKTALPDQFSDNMPVIIIGSKR